MSEATAAVDTAAEAPRVVRGITVNDPKLQALQKRLAFLTMTVPAVGTIAAVALLWYRPLTWTDFVIFAVMYSTTLIGVTDGFHRLFAHNSFKANNFLKAALGILGSMAAQGTLIYWAATHRRHHMFSEGEGDPHSPYYLNGKTPGFWHGLWHSHLGWMLNSTMTNTVRFGKDLMRDPVIAKVNELYYVWIALGFVIPAVAGGLISQSWYGALTGVLWGGMVRMFLVHHVMWTSGSTAHIIGVRPFETGDRSTNNALFAFANFGEAFHNNHHAFPYSAKFGLKWWHFDLGGWVILACEKLGWASEVRSPDKVAIAEKLKSNKNKSAPAAPAQAAE